MQLLKNLGSIYLIDSYSQWYNKLLGQIISELLFVSEFLYINAVAIKDYIVFPKPISSHNAPLNPYLNKKLIH